MERTVPRRVFVVGIGALGLSVLGGQLISGFLAQGSQEENVSMVETSTVSTAPEIIMVEKVDWPEATVTPVSTVIPIWPSLEEAEIYKQKTELLNLTKLPTPTPTPKPTPTETIANLAGSFIWRGDANKPNVAITVDDGWWEEPIVKITQILRETKTKLTLFIPGQAISAFPKLWRELDGIGCKIECHSYTHRFDVAKLSIAEIVDEIDRSQSVLDRVLGRHEPFSFYRPAGGVMSENLVRALSLRNLRGVIWTLSGQGTSPIATAETVTQRILSLAGNGYITLHHFSKNDADALKPIILGLRAKGLTPSRLDETV